MKILLLSYEYPPDTGFGGIGTYTWYHARALAQLGHEVHVLAGATEATALRTAVQEGVMVHRFRAARAVMQLARLFGARQLHWTRNRIENAWSMFLGFRQLGRLHQFDIIEMPECGAEGALINRFTTTPTVVRFHSPSRLIMPFYNVRKLDIALCSWIEQMGIDAASRLSSCSTFLTGEVRGKLGVGRSIVTIPNGIDLPLFDREPVVAGDELAGVPPGETTILFAGRMEPRKGIALCARIVELLLARRRATFLFAGEDLFGYVQDTMLPQLAAKGLSASVRFLGKLSLAQVRALSRRVDIYLLPSLWENCPYSCLEAMAAGRAIVASNQGGMPELIQHGENGLLAVLESPQSFADQLELLIDDRELRRRLGEAARRSVEEHFTDKAVSAKAVALYQSCMLSHSRIGSANGNPH